MKEKDIRPILRSLASSLDNFQVRKTLVYSTPVGDVLRGLYFESSGFSKNDFYIWVFVQPLIVPSGHLVFNFGDRLRGRGGEGWELDAPDLADSIVTAVRQKALPFIAGAQSIAELPHWLDQSPSRNTPNGEQANAYALAASGRLDEAEASLKRLRAMLDPRRQMDEGMDRRAAMLQRAIRETPESLNSVFSDWKEETKKALGIAGIE